MLQHLSGLILVALAAWAPALGAAEFAILPLVAHLDRATRATEITVRNDDQVPMRVQMEAMTWRQSAGGEDQYEPADGLLYFPRAMEIAPGESRIVRVGVKAVPVTREETYRLFIEELPPALSEGAASQGVSLQILLRVGVPVFVAPAQAFRKAEIPRLDLRGGSAEWAITNDGNVHFRADRVELAGIGRNGTRLFTQQFSERYFLAGVVKTLRFDIPREMCGQLAMLEASVVADNLDLKRKLDVEPGSCR
jgi:fimbrial chaperone protein